MKFKIPTQTKNLTALPKINAPSERLSKIQPPRAGNRVFTVVATALPRNWCSWICLPFPFLVREFLPWTGEVFFSDAKTSWTTSKPTWFRAENFGLLGSANRFLRSWQTSFASKRLSVVLSPRSLRLRFHLLFVYCLDTASNAACVGGSIMVCNSTIRTFMLNVRLVTLKGVSFLERESGDRPLLCPSNIVICRTVQGDLDKLSRFWMMFSGS